MQREEDNTLIILALGIIAFILMIPVGVIIIIGFIRKLF